jgi:hypothetical protein
MAYASPQLTPPVRCDAAANLTRQGLSHPESATQRDDRCIINEIREIFIAHNDNIPANAYIEGLWRSMSTSHLYMALGNFRRMEA